MKHLHPLLRHLRSDHARRHTPSHSRRQLHGLVRGPTRRWVGSGFTIVEALVVLVLLCIGAIALMTLQVRLRVVADEVRHHDQALRLAHNELERWRWQPDGPTPALSWEGPDIEYAVAGSAVLASDALGRGADEGMPEAGAAVPPLRPVQVRVQWTDRTGRPQAVTLESLLPLTDPAFSGLLQLPPGSRR
jgi:diaminohydroxyphosphoribosylaminopyrimidine deaminase/5-amino-6-(5-phosphoribosylamino)uracil reductase